MTPLRQRMIEKMVRRNHCDRTIKTYVGTIAAIAKHYKEPPTRLNADEVRAWQFHARARSLLLHLQHTLLRRCQPSACSVVDVAALQRENAALRAELASVTERLTTHFTGGP